VSTIEERVARGAAWLDGKLPDWWQALDLDPAKFDMAAGCGCVIGQLYPIVEYFDQADHYDSPFDVAMDGAWLDLDWETAVSHGFYVRLLEAERAGEYDALTAEWRRVITERRAAA